MTALRHALCWYSGDTDLHARLGDVVVGALREGGTVAVELRPATEVALRGRVADELGADAVAGLLRLERQAGPDGPSGQTDAVRAARVLRAHAERIGGPLTVVAEHAAVHSGADAYWNEIEAAVHVALADLPLELLCFFPDELPQPLVPAARAAHPFDLHDGDLVPTGEACDPRRLLAERPAPVPAELGPPLVDLAFDGVRLRDVRAAVDRAMREQGFTRSRAEDVTVAVNEVATNAVQHGGGKARLMLWTPDADVVCEIHDSGTLADPLPGLAPPDPGAEHGRGIWIARQLCDLLHVWADVEGTHVRIRAAA
ncbi:ATP-binding protein [Pseudonocardia nematodicida]|uniref:ATP-binding protein n=1 Tax=Pseudonocardia nematodicida TaxID=1206997 RepID=A0ABV1K6G3_9PSEU